MTHLQRQLRHLDMLKKQSEARLKKLDKMEAGLRKVDHDIKVVKEAAMKVESMEAKRLRA